MFGQWQEPQTDVDHGCATSPWTELYQAASESQRASQRENHRQMAEAQRMFEVECQRPTHDALSDVYNRG